mmetsp:Transcript_7275/g.10420  ORF Transcript_7275/g.10420 Transcript_7275/m.10420 type:complete len:326 (+) Transcript_7275:243-1220(+)
MGKKKQKQKQKQHHQQRQHLSQKEIKRNKQDDTYSKHGQQLHHTVSTTKSNRKSKHEHNGKPNKQKSGEYEDDYSFRQLLAGDGSNREIIEMKPDGNCLFSSISHGLYNDFGQNHDVVRKDICDHLEENEEKFKVFLFLDDENEDVCDIKNYVDKMRTLGEWGGDVEIVAAAQRYSRNIKIYSFPEVFNVNPDSESIIGPDLLLSYHDNSHYNCIVDISQNSAMHAMKVEKKEEEQNHDQNEIRKSTKSTKNFKNGITQKRNDLCKCGSGFRYKKCCFAKHKKQNRREHMNCAHPQQSDLSEDDKENGTSTPNKGLEGNFQVIHL